MHDARLCCCDSLPLDFVRDMLDNADICAISTPAGQGGIAVIRVSGDNALVIAQKIIESNKPRISGFSPRKVYLCNIVEGSDLIDEVLFVWFKAPYSYTGQDMVEISCHGSLYIQHKIIDMLIVAGARIAMPGEFTQRAFLNGKIDLSQSEAIADLIASGAKASHRLAINQMKGKLSNEILLLREKLLEFISLIELELDFSEEDVEFADRKQLNALIAVLIARISELLATFRYGNAIKNGIPVTIAGKPNTGKSSLLNMLVNEDRAIVSNIPGTTRDTIEEQAVIDGYFFRFIDTAGIRHTSNEIEIIGIERARKRIALSEIILLVADSGQTDAEIIESTNEIQALMDISAQHLIVLINKTDLSPERNYCLPFEVIPISATTGINIEVLKTKLVQIVEKNESCRE